MLTAPDSYRFSRCRRPGRLRTSCARSPAAQLDGRLVWLFATQVLRGRHAEHRGRIADLETELQVQRKVRGMLDSPFLLGPPMA